MPQTHIKAIFTICVAGFLSSWCSEYYVVAKTEQKQPSNTCNFIKVGIRLDLSRILFHSLLPSSSCGKLALIHCPFYMYMLIVRQTILNVSLNETTRYRIKYVLAIFKDRNEQKQQERLKKLYTRYILHT